MTESANATTDINAILRQAEIQQVQMQLELQFRRNMALFQQFAPTIYQQYNEYSPETLHLSYTDEGYLNLINSQSGNPVYNTDPKDFCANQLQQFQAMPVKYRIGFNRPDDEHFFQRVALNQMMEAINDEFMPDPDLSKPIGMMVINGCGLGYHIPELIDCCDIHTLVINEPTRDSFYASLHSIDWSPIIDCFRQPGRMLKLYIANEDEHTITGLRLLTNRIGMHNITNTYFYSHLSGPKNDAFEKDLKKQFHLTLTGVGFLEDEQISIAHTTANTNANLPILNNQPTLADLPPAFLIGNGPSLDHSIETIKQMQDKVIIVSCGSTLPTLYRHGIVPDYHVEMERTYETYPQIAALTDQEYRDKITLVALNTVMPATMNLFTHKVMAMKANDAAEIIINDHYGDSIPPLSSCNPTCTNMGLSLLLQLGFRNIYLHGVDLGMRNRDEHHAKSSYYYDSDNKIDTDTRAEITVEGNFGGTVYTTAILNTSNANMTILAQHYPLTNIFNTSDGALIRGVTPLPIDQLEVADCDLDKASVKQSILEQNFSSRETTEELTEKKIKKRYLKEFYKLENTVKLKPGIRNIAQLQEELDSIHLKVFNLKETAPMAYWLLNGSLQTFFTIVLNHGLSNKSEEEFRKQYRITSGLFNDFMTRCYELMNEHCLTHDCEAPVHRGYSL